MSGGYVAPTSKVLRGEVGENADGLYTCVSFDPGGTTGWALFQVWMEALRSSDYSILDNVAFWSAGEFTGPEVRQAEQMVELVRHWPGCHVVVEQFVLRQLQVDLAPERLNARFESLLARDVPAKSFILQQPALAKSTITDDTLSRAGLSAALAGKPHAKDAVRHNLTWLRRAKAIYTVESRGGDGKR